MEPRTDWLARTVAAAARAARQAHEDLKSLRRGNSQLIGYADIGGFRNHALDPIDARSGAAGGKVDETLWPDHDPNASADARRQIGPARHLDGATALEMLRECRYELVISDFRMEPVTGLELLASIRANSRLRETCFLMMAGGTETEQVSAAYSAGTDAFILKPFTASMLRSKLREIFESRRLLFS